MPSTVNTLLPPPPQKKGEQKQEKTDQTNKK